MKHQVKELDESFGVLKKVLEDEKATAKMSLVLLKRVGEPNSQPGKLIIKKLEMKIRRSNELIRTSELVQVGIKEIIAIEEKFDAEDKVLRLAMNKWLGK